jgi:hypothetical protein
VAGDKLAANYVDSHAGHRPLLRKEDERKVARTNTPPVTTTPVLSADIASNSGVDGRAHCPPRSLVSI